MHQHHHHHDHASHVVHFDSPEMADFAELEGEVLVGFTRQAIARLDHFRRRVGLDVGRVLDIGCGPGVATGLLAQAFGSAAIVAVDGSATMLERVDDRVARLGLAHRIETHRADLPEGLEAFQPAEVVWASMVLHHVGDERDALRRMRSVLQPGGLLTVIERAGPVRVLPANADGEHADIWTRIDAAWAKWFADMRADLPCATPSSDYAVMLEDAGYEVLADELLTIVLDAPLDTRARQFALTQLRRSRAQLERHADAADLAAFDALIGANGEGDITCRDDAQLQATRLLYLARPAGGVQPPLVG
jgi:trans-aconitate methyltransferase